MNVIESLSSKGVIKLSVFNDDRTEYKITLNDPYKEMSRRLAFALPLQNSHRLFIASQSSRADVLPAGEVVKQMETVVIKTKNDNSIYWSRGTNECGDYVCMYNNLNCINHPPGTSGTRMPVVGARHRVNGVETVYYGCSAMWASKNPTWETTIDGVRMPMEFYVDDPSKQSGSQYLSTIYWKHVVLTDANGEALVEFYTGDITGRFRVVVQGVTDTDVFYGDHSFEVQK
jgi:hypothetical protein